MHQNPHIALIGSGLSSLSAAYSLRENHADITLIDSQLYLGGRGRGSRMRDGIMSQMGATFSYDSGTRNALESVGARVAPIDERKYYVRLRGEFHQTGVSDGPRGAVERIAAEISQNERNISIAHALDQCDQFRLLSPMMKKMTAGLLSADVAGELHRVGISSLRYDGQTVIGSPDIGVCVKGGFRNLASALARASGFVQSVGSGSRESLFLTQLRGIGYGRDGGLELFLHDRKEGFQKDGEQILSSLSVDAAFIGLPVTAVKRLNYFMDGKEQGSLSRQFPAEMQHALTLIEPGHVVKISVLLDRPLIEESPVCHITVLPEMGSAIHCSEVWCLPAPSRTEFPSTPEQGKQVVLLYLAGEQALGLRQFLLRERDRRRESTGVGEGVEERTGLSNALRVEVVRFLANHLGVDPKSILGTRTSMWSGERAEPYTYIRADNKSSSFNPRAQFDQQAMPGIWIGGSEFSLRSTLVGGALESGVRHARNIAASIPQVSDSLAVELSKSS